MRTLAGARRCDADASGSPGTRTDRAPRAGSIGRHQRTAGDALRDQDHWPLPVAAQLCPPAPVPVPRPCPGRPWYVDACVCACMCVRARVCVQDKPPEAAREADTDLATHGVSNLPTRQDASLSSVSTTPPRSLTVSVRRGQRMRTSLARCRPRAHTRARVARWPSFRTPARAQCHDRMTAAACRLQRSPQQHDSWSVRSRTCTTTACATDVSARTRSVWRPTGRYELSPPPSRIAWPR